MNDVAWWYYRNYHRLHRRDRVEWQEFACMLALHEWPSWAQIVFSEVTG